MSAEVSALLRNGALWVLMALLTFGLVLLARDELIGAIAAVVAAGFVLFVAFFGSERSGRYVVVAGFFAAPLSALVVPGASFITLTDVLFGLGFGLLLPTMILSRKTVQAPLLYTAGVLIAVLMGTLASLVAVETLASFNMFARYIIGVILVPLVLMVWKPPVRVIGHLAMAYALGTVASIGYGVIRNGERPGTRFIGVTEHPNVLGITGMLGLALIPFIWSRIQPRHRWFWVGVAGVNAGAVWFSGSRAALVVSIAVVLMWPVVERSIRGGAWMVLALSVGVLVADQIFSSGSDSAISRLLGGGSAVASDAERANLLRHYWSEFLERPIIGHGFEEAVLGHNVYLQIAHSMGVFGFLSFVFILLAGALALVVARRPLHRIAYPVIAYAMIAMITSVVWDRYIWAPLALAFAMVVLDRSSTDVEETSPNLLSRRQEEPARER